MAVVLSVLFCNCNNADLECDNLGYSGAIQIFVTDSIISGVSNSVVIKLDTACNYLPDDWSVHELGFEEHFGFRISHHSNNLYYACLDEKTKIPNGMECGWLKVEKIMDDGRSALKITVDQNDSVSHALLKLVYAERWTLKRVILQGVWSFAVIRNMIPLLLK